MYTATGSRLPERSSAKCPCSTAVTPADFAKAVESFYLLREKWAALRLVIPDEILPRHRAFTLSSLDQANHVSVPFLTYRNGRLFEFTAPLHAMLCDATGAQRKVENQYLKDLRETWIFQSDVISRFRQSRRFLARIAELGLINISADHKQVARQHLGGGLGVELIGVLFCCSRLCDFSPLMM